MSNLDRIEKLLNINSNPSLFTEERLLLIFNKLTEYMSNTKSMLYECLLTLAETVNNAQEREECILLEEGEEQQEDEDDQYEDDQYENDEEHLSNQYEDDQYENDEEHLSDQNEDDQQLSDEGSIISK